MFEHIHIGGYILSGGKNRRMGGQKKLFLELHGEQFYGYIVQALSVLPSIYLSVENTVPYEHLHIELIPDEIPNIGPIGGLYSGLRSVPEDALLVVPCDMPLITQKDVITLLNAYRSRPVTTVTELNHKIYPFPGIYPKSCLPQIEEMIQSKNYKIMDLLGKLCALQFVPFSNPQALKNVNTLSEYYDLLHNRPGF